MNILSYLNSLKLKGIKLWLEGDKLKFSAAKGVMTTEIKSELQSKKADIIAFLTLQETHYQDKRLAYDGKLPLSFAQKTILTASSIIEDKRVYNEECLLKISGDLAIDKLEEAFQAIVERHEILRLRVSYCDGTPFLKTSNNNEVALSVVNLNTSEHHFEQALSEVLETHRNQEFDFENDLLLRAKLVQLENNTCLLSIVTHHFIGDAWSEKLLLDELNFYYHKMVNKAEVTLPRLTSQYTDIAIEDIQKFESGQLDEQLAYWADKLCDVPVLHSLPLDRTRPQVQTFNGQESRFKLPHALSKKLNVFCRETGVTEYSVLLANLSILIALFSHENDVVIGTPALGRHDVESESLLGMFANNVVMRNQIDIADSFTKCVKRVFSSTLEALDNQAVPFDKVMEKVSPPRSLSYSPLFQIMFAMRNIGNKLKPWRAVNVEKLETKQKFAKYDLLFIVESQDGVHEVIWEYNEAIFDSETIRHFSNVFLELLSQGMEAKDQKIEDFQLSCESQDKANNINGEFAELFKNIQKFATETPDKIAIEDKAQTINFAQLSAQISAIKNNLLENGVTSGTRVALTLDRNANYVPFILAVMSMGAVFVPVDKNLPVERAKYIVMDSEATFWVHDGELNTTVDIRLLPAAQLRESIGEVNLDNDVCDVERSLAYILYTSGTTGKPKGVRVKYDSLANFIGGISLYLDLDDKTHLLAVTPNSFDMSVFEHLAPIYGGGSLYIADQSQCDDIFELRRLLENSKLNVLQTTPGRWQMLLDSGWQGNHELLAISGGDALSAELASSIRAKTKQLYNGYGPTEATVYTLVKELTHVENHLSLTTLGGLLPNYEYFVCNKGLILPDGAVGELVITGNGVAEGYQNLPLLTEEKFPLLQTRDGGLRQVYRTGDLVRFNREHELEYLGRIDHQVKLSGYRIELEDVQFNINEIKGIKDSFVDICENQAAPFLVAYIVCDTCFDVQKTDVITALRQKLPEFMVPSEFHFLANIPLSTNGKVDRSELQKIRSSIDAVVEENMSETEVVLLTLWQETLERKNISIDANFFQIGGNSLLLVSLIGRMTKKFDLSFAVKEIYHHPTIREFAELINHKNSEKALAAQLTSEIHPKESSKKDTVKLWI